MYDGKKVIVLGAAGFVGRWVARKLCQNGAEVFLVVRNETAALPIFQRYNIQGQVLELNLENTAALEKVYASVRPAITFNLAGYGIDRSERDESKFYQINAKLLEDVCPSIGNWRDASWPGLNFVHTGSALEYGNEGGVLSEVSGTTPGTFYGQSKLAGTNYLTKFCQDTKMKGITVRLFTVYGPGEHPGRLLPSLLEAARTKQEIPLTSGEQLRDFTYVEEVAEGLLRLGAATAEPGDVVNLATGNLSPVKTFVETAAEVLNIPREKLRYGAIQTHYEELPHTSMNLNHLHDLIQWKPSKSIAEGIRQTAAFLSDDWSLGGS